MLLEEQPETGSTSKVFVPGQIVPNFSPECKIVTDPFTGGNGGRGQYLAENHLFSIKKKFKSINLPFNL